MKTKQPKNITKRLAVWAIVVAGILLIPLLTKVPWTVGDFIFAGVVLYGCASFYELTTRSIENKMQRVVVGFAVAMALILIWGWAVA